MNEYSVFVSHSSEDKIEYVKDLVEEIKSLGVSVFYDEDVITWGDNLKEKIDFGLQSCQLAVIIISPSYFGREWTEYELKILLERQDTENCKLILPILYKTSKEEFVKHYPSLKNILFKHAKSQSKKDLALDLKKELDKKMLKKAG
ncbi:MAG: toll/interleukin-1 receptor domain-containing protein [Clostridia bacterium]|nr:toll/interleukin-1 receptor domain-containing protein [Clostridia bacterium]